MTKQEAFEIMNSAGVFSLATVDNGLPRVRGCMLYRADENGIIFHTGVFKDLYRQLIANPHAELCFNDPKSGVQIRVSGTMQPINDKALKDEIVAHPSRAFLREWCESDPAFYDHFIVFSMTDGVATSWTMATNNAPKEYFNL